MEKGRVTIPTDATYVKETKKIMDYWGADAIRDCDGVSLPKDLKQFHCDVYKAYFIVREDREYAKEHPEYWQNVALMSPRRLAESDTIAIDLLEGSFKESLAVNPLRHREFWQVIDRTSGKEHEEWTYDGKGSVILHGCQKYHEYTVNFFAKNTWDPVQIYNYHVNGWTCPKDIDLDPVYPEALSHMLLRMEKWLKENPDVTTVRFTTFFYNFFIVNVTGLTQRIWDWHNYAMTASPAMFDLFKKETGLSMTLEDIVAGGFYSNRFLLPTKTMRRYVDFVERKCASWAKLFVDLCHKYGKKAIMFDGDHRIGVEPYSPYFASIGLDGVVGAPSSSIYAQQVANIQGVQFTEGRLNPYFFPNECPGDERGTAILRMYWSGIRRGLMKKCIDRIGFGGYLKQIEDYHTFKAAVKEVCDEFRNIRDALGDSSCLFKLKVAVLSYWGKMDSWMQNGIFVDDVRQDGYYYRGVLSALSTLPIDVDFLSFDDVKDKNLEGYDVLISNGIPHTSFSGDSCWADPDLVSKIREYVSKGGGFLGVGEPSGFLYGGRYFQLADVLGVEKECNFTHFEKRPDISLCEDHPVLRDVDLSKVRFNPFVRGVYPLGGTVLKAHFDETYPYGYQNAGHVDLAIHNYDEGRSVYLSGLGESNLASRLIYNLLLWAAKKEDKKFLIFSTNPDVDAYYYPNTHKYGLINSTDKPQRTSFYDKAGKRSELDLLPHEIRWINENGKE